MKLVVIGVFLLLAPFKAMSEDDDAILNFKQIHTTMKRFAGDFLGTSDVQPMNGLDAPGFHFPNGFGKDCNADPSMSHAGYRLVQDGSPTMAILYDSKFRAAGMQSLVPSDTFVGYDCLENGYYAKETIEDVEYCVTTIYFKDPSAICQVDSDQVDSNEEAAAAAQLHIQKGNNFQAENIVPVPKSHRYAVSNQFWSDGGYFPGMGQHVSYIPTYPHFSNDCTKMIPFQFVYGRVDGHCVNTGFMFSHWNTTVVDDHRHAWETLPVGVVVTIRKVHYYSCEIVAAKKKMEKSMHVFLGGSTDYCINDN